MALTDKQIVDYLAELFSDPRRWVQKTEATDANGHSVDARSPDATCLCLIGGFRRFASGTPQVARLERLAVQYGPNNYKSAPSLNDNPKTNHETIVTTLKAVSNHFVHTGTGTNRY